MKNNKIKAECSSCGGTGVYCGFAEAKGTGVVCLDCGGTGEQIIYYKPFEGKKGRRNVETVYLSRGTFIATGIGSQGKGVSYQEFKKALSKRAINNLFKGKRKT